MKEARVLFGSRMKTTPVTADQALPGRDRRPYPVPESHAVLGTPLEGPWPDGTEVIHVAMGCFWGAEKAFWSIPGVVSTAVGYQGGHTPNPSYEETCTARTGHTEAVLVAYDPTQVTAAALLKVFWESHDPTQGNRQGNDVGTQYRSAVYWTNDQQRQAYESTKAAFQPALTTRGYGQITTEARSAQDAGPFYYAEDYHQQYLSEGKNPRGYCGLGGTGANCPIGLVDYPAPAGEGRP
jgi:peptide-methionine (S)-S-oxide reductase